MYLAKGHTSHDEKRLSVEELARRRTNGHMLRRYGITLDEYEVMLEAQGGVCKMCKKPPTVNRRPHTDHCHKTGVVRGILCGPCNTRLGTIEDEAFVALATAYLSRFAMTSAEPVGI